MLQDRRKNLLVALALIAPFAAIYALAFAYPTIQMFRISFTSAPLIGAGDWVGIENYTRLGKDPLFSRAVWNTLYFVALTDRKSTRLNSSHVKISYAVFCLKKKKQYYNT